jgi:hypothetical protein
MSIKRLSQMVMILWMFFPLAIKLTEREGFHPNWLWFSIIWVVMGILGGCATYLFHIMEDYKTEE